MTKKARVLSLLLVLIALVLLVGTPWQLGGRGSVANAQKGPSGASGPLYSARGAPAGPSDGGAAMPATPPDVAPMGGSLSEGFDDITTLPGAGWVLTNNSQPVGTSSWFQGNSTVFTAHSGAATSYIGANFNNTAGTGTISNWLMTPVLTLANGSTFTFWTRVPTGGSQFPDRLQVRMSLAGSSSNTGGTATSVGDFTTLLLDINPTYGAAYPEVWTEYTITLSGIATPTQGRLAFRYFVENGGPSGTNSNYIGIDTVAYTSTGGPTPTPLPPTATVTPLPAGTYCASPAVAIPDNNPTGVSSTITVPDTGILTDVNVFLNVTHTWVGDTAFTLTHNAASSTLIDRPGVPASTFGCSGDNINNLIDDEGTLPAETSCANTTPAYPAGGVIIPETPLSVFDGQDRAGAWTLTATDGAAGDTGTLNQWCISFTPAGGPTPTATVVPPTATVVPPTATLPPTSIELGGISSSGSAPAGGWLISLLGLGLVALGLVAKRRR